MICANKEPSKKVKTLEYKKADSSIVFQHIHTYFAGAGAAFVVVVNIFPTSMTKNKWMLFVDEARNKNWTNERAATTAANLCLFLIYFFFPSTP